MESAKGRIWYCRLCYISIESVAAPLPVAQAVILSDWYEWCGAMSTEQNPDEHCLVIQFRANVDQLAALVTLVWKRDLQFQH